MRVLLMGQIKGFGEALSHYISKKRKTVVAVDLFNDDDKAMSVSGTLILHKNQPAHTEALYSTLDFDQVIFLSPPTDYYYKHNDTLSDNEEWLSHFIRLLHASHENKIKKFVFLSSLYSDIDPETANFDGIRRIWDIQTAENYCDKLRSNYQFDIVTLKLPMICCLDGMGNFEDMIIQGRIDGEIQLLGSESTAAEFIVDLDLCRIVNRVMMAKLSGEFQIGGENITLEYLSILINKSCGIESKFIPADYPDIPEGSKKFMINDLNFEQSYNIDNCLEHIVINREKRMTGKRIQKNYMRFLKPLLPILEVILGFFLLDLTPRFLGERFAWFSFIDIRLIFVVIIAAFWGLKYGIASGLVATVSYFIFRMGEGKEFVDILFSEELFLPVSVFILAGVLIGYSFDIVRKRAEIAEAKERSAEEKYHFLAQSFKGVVQSKETLAQQVANYSDSFGKIYKIATDLDFIQPERIFLSAVSILEESFNSKSVAIYFLNKNNLSYARLMACSQEESGNLSSSLKMSLLPDVFSILFTHKIFINRNLNPKSPAYATYIYEGSQPIALVVIYTVDFDAYSYYYANLFRVITGLIQNALVKAYQYYNPNIGSPFFPDTNIYTYNAMLEKLEAKKLLRERTGAQFTVLQIQNPNLTLEMVNRFSKTVIRESDEIGLGNDGHYYVILSFTSAPEADIVINRFENKGVISKVVDGI